MFQSYEQRLNQSMFFVPDGCVFVEPKERIGYAQRSASPMTNREVTTIHQPVVTDDAHNRLMGDGFAVGAGVEVEIVESLQLRQALQVVGGLKAARRVGQD